MKDRHTHTHTHTHTEKKRERERKKEKERECKERQKPVDLALRLSPVMAANASSSICYAAQTMGVSEQR